MAHHLIYHAGVAELADAHDSKSCSFWSVGSTPTTGTIFIYAPVAQLDRASDYGSEGYGFDSCRARHL